MLFHRGFLSGNRSRRRTRGGQPDGATVEAVSEGSATADGNGERPSGSRNRRRRRRPNKPAAESA